jgi:hypothetical protein
MTKQRSTSLEWRERGRDFYSDLTGRFDLWFAPAHGWWVCVDWESGTAERGEREVCETWAAGLMAGEQLMVKGVAWAR